MTMKDKLPKVVILWTIFTFLLVSMFVYTFLQYVSYKEVLIPFTMLFKPLIIYNVYAGVVYIIFTAYIVFVTSIKNELVRDTIAITGIYVVVIMVAADAYMYHRSERLTMSLLVGAFITVYVIFLLIRRVWNKTGED